MKLCEECKRKEASVCSDCCQSIAEAMFQNGTKHGPRGLVVKYIEAETGHKWPMTAADMTAKPNLKILKDYLHATEW